MKDMHTEQVAVEELLGNLLSNDLILKSRLAIWLENQKVRSPGYYLAKRVQDIAEARMREDSPNELNVSPPKLAERLAKLEKQMKTLEERLDALATKADIANVRGDIKQVERKVDELRRDAKEWVNETRDIVTGKANTQKKVP